MAQIAAEPTISAPIQVLTLRQPRSGPAVTAAELARELVLENGGPVAGLGLLARMFAGSTLDASMVALFRRLHADGVPTGLLSNSWGGAYPTDLFPDMFDAVVISSEVGMRKPEPRIFLHAAGLLGLEPQDCIFIDDIQANIAAAEQLGFTGVLHIEAAGTAERVAELLDIKPALLRERGSLA